VTGAEPSSVLTAPPLAVGDPWSEPGALHAPIAAPAAASGTSVTNPRRDNRVDVILCMFLELLVSCPHTATALLNIDGSSR
jgi:hypothetical protein